MATTIAKLIRVIGTNSYVKTAELVQDVTGKTVNYPDTEQPIINVELTDNVMEAKAFNGGNNDAENFVQSAPDSGFLTKAFSDPLEGGVNRYEVVPILVGDPVPNWIN